MPKSNLLSRIMGGKPAAKPEPYWRMGLADDGAHEILIYGVIGQMEFADEPSLEALTLVREIEAIQAKTIRLRLLSPGGFVADAAAIYNALQRHPATVETWNDGEASSAASYLFMAGDRRVMASNALLMIHSAWTFAAGNAKALRSMADSLDKQNDVLVPAYARSGMDQDEIRGLLADGENHWFTPEEAIAAGFATEIEQALPVAAMHSFDVHQPPRALLVSRPQPTASDTTAATGGDSFDTGVNPMNWITLALSLGLSLTDKKDQAAAMRVVATHLDLAEDADEDTIAKALADASAVDVQGAVEKAMAADRNRRSAVRQVFSRWSQRRIPGVEELERECLDDPAVTAEAAGTRLLTLVGNQAEPLATGNIVHGADERDKRIQGMTAALLSRMGVQDKDNPVDASNPFRGMRLAEMGRYSLQLAGCNVQGMHPEEFADQALSRRPLAAQTTSDFPVVLENTLHKMVLSGFMAQRTTWDQFCKVGDVTDFRAWNRLVPGLIGNLETVNEHGEYNNKNLPDAEKNPVSASRRGNIIAITAETLINDDLGYIQTLASSLGQAGARTIDRAVYALLDSNPTLSNGNALFSAGNNNLAGAGAAPTVTTLSAGRDAMARQTAPGDDAEFLDIVPSISVSSHEVKSDIEVQVNSQFDPEASNKLQRANKVRGMVGTLVGTPRISGNEWYLFADPMIAPVVEVVFLNGQREPRITQEENFRTSGLSWKVELPFGVGAIDFRGAWKNPGA